MRLRPSLFLILLVLPVVLLALHPIDSADIWTQLTTGDWIARHHAVPRTDVFAAAARPWIVHDWLAGLILFALHSAGGAPALVLLATLVTVFALALPFSRAPWPAASWYGGALLVSAGIAYERFFVRPEVFSFAGVALWTHLLTRGKPQNARGVILLGLLQVVWANLHASCVLGPVLAALAVGGDALERRRRQDGCRPALNRARVVLPFVCLAACLVTPYGPESLAHLLKTGRDISSGSLAAGVVEWQPTFSQPVPGDFVLMLFVASALGTVAAAVIGRRPLPGFESLTVLFFIVLACTARRHLALYAIAVPPIAAGWLASWRAARPAPASGSTGGGSQRARFRWGRAFWPHLARVGRVLLAGLALGWSAAILRGSFYAWAGPPRSVGWNVASGTHPLGAAAFVTAHGFRGPLFNNIAAGSALLWQSRGRLPVLVDGRLLDPARFQVYRRCLESMPAFDAWVAVERPQLIVLALQPYAPGRLFRHLDASPDWRLVHFDGTGAVFVTTAEAGARDLAPISLARALPGNTAPAGAAGTWWRRCDPGEAAVRGRVLLQLGFAAAAAVDLQRALLHCTGNWDLGRDLGAAWVLAGRYAEAEPLLLRALEHDVSDPDIWMHLGSCRAAAGDPASARLAWQRAARLRPSDPRPSQLMRTLPGD